MQILIIVEILGLGGIERSAIRIGEELLRKYSNLSKKCDVTIAYCKKLTKHADSKSITFKQISEIEKSYDWVLINIDDGQFVGKLNIPINTRLSIICHFPRRIVNIKEYSDIWTISHFNCIFLKHQFPDIKVIYNPIENLLNKKKCTIESPNKIIGRISRKDIAKLDFDSVLSLIILSWNDYQIKVVGYPYFIEKLITFLGKSTNIQFLDEISEDSRLEEFYSSIDLLIHGSFAGETFGMVITEAIRFNKPVLYSGNYRKGLAPHELLDPGYIGYGFWDIVKKAKGILNSNKINCLHPGLNEKYLTAESVVNSLLSKKGFPEHFNYHNLFAQKRNSLIFRIYIAVTNYSLKLCYLLLK